VRPGRLLVFAALAGGCIIPGRNRSDVPASRQSPARDTLLATDRSRSDSIQKLGGVAAMRAFVATDAVYLLPGAPLVYGGDNVVALLRSASPRLGTVASLQPAGGGLSRDGLAGYTFGFAVRSGGEQPAGSIERYLAFWSRARGGPWRIIAYAEVTSVSAPWGGSAGTTGGLSRAPAARAEAYHEMMAADSSFADRAGVFGIASAAKSALSDDAVLLGASELVVGPRAATEYFQARRDLSVSWSPRAGYVAGTTDLGFTVGDALSTSRGPTGAAAQRFSKYLTVWRRDADGRWRIVATGSNARPSPLGD
jgi:ketosteroid isomerase-like protein